ncbi:carbohydrate-binding protein SusD [Niastella yeongjuensis]|uniref:Carbohydrate-binding protein SusD n=1 Tax=Niastella yeongjuensis TaxID=354355 RepID=A0A1V9DXQ8_9BACT|nr:RagB/SusD family nutrient uptake outer membrane protein [Niastella yeongjuensis]OQP38663.1 carbohydrate-binding protein SusD [Niastella yeongjuensis]SEO37525.1 Starch-binding associating with outer membrane [Niastella yeongjuensis]
MNKNIFIISGLLLFLITSCSRDLNLKPISASTTVTFYANANDFTQGVYAAYSSLRTYPDRLLNLSETRSDNLYAVSDGGVRDWEGINDFQKTIASNPYVGSAWTNNYNGIYKCNVLIDELAKNGSVINDNVLQTRMEAEAKFLRAFFYFDLIRTFGKVPLVDKPLSAAEALKIGRTAVSAVYDLVISDLKFASDNLPENVPSAEKGRASKYAAKGMLALVYMTRSGPTYDIEGPGLGLNEWGQAVALLNEIIGSNKFSFLTSYPDIFNYGNENNGEVVFDIQYVSGANPSLGSTFPSLLVPDTYFRSMGKVDQNGLSIRPISNSLFNSYEPGDTRKAFSIKTGYVYNRDAETRSFYLKYLDTTKVPTKAVDWSVNYIVLRYTDVLMLKAECVLHGAPGSLATDVDAVVNQVRTRAGLTTPKTNITLPQLMDERRREFAAEGSRWHDLVRSGLVETVMTSWIAADDVQHKISPFQKEYIIYPVPQSEMDVNQPLFQQNTGY